MIKKITILIIFQLLSCKGQDKNNCSKENAYNNVIKIKEVENVVEKYKNSSEKIIFEIDEGIYENKKYYIIKEEQKGKFHNSVWNIFYVNQKDCSLYYYDTVSGDLLTIEQWRQLGKKDNKKDMEKIKFTDMFNEGTNIKFTPDDLNKTDSEIEDFKKKLILYNEQHPLIEDFDISNLSYLLNNETFFDLQHYTNSSWLQYFITKYKIEGSKLNDLMQQAIQQEDYNAVKILIDNNYIVSQKDLNTLTKTEKEIKDKVQENKTDGYESYIISNSKINLISNEINKKLHSYKVSDPDGYTNLRKDKNASSEILQKIKSGEHINILDNSGDWFLAETKEGKQGYVHESRVKAN